MIELVAFIGLEGVNYVFSHVSLILVAIFYLVFLQICYSLISSCLSWLHGNSISRLVSRTIGTPSQYVVHGPPYFWHRTRGFLKARRSWEPGSSLTTGKFPLFRLLPKDSGANITGRESYLSSSLKSSN